VKAFSSSKLLPLALFVELAAVTTLSTRCRDRHWYLQKSKSAQTDVLTIGEALSAYRAENGSYPPLPSGNAKELERFLEPKYITHVPAIDPWGNPYQVQITRISYAAWSNGADGHRDAHWQISRTVGEECDIVVENDRYTQYPVGIASPGAKWEHASAAPIRDSCPAVDGPRPVKSP